MADAVEQFMEDAQILPGRLQRLLALMADLDRRQTVLAMQAQRCEAAYLQRHLRACKSKARKKRQLPPAQGAGDADAGAGRGDDDNANKSPDSMQARKAANPPSASSATATFSDSCSPSQLSSSLEPSSEASSSDEKTARDFSKANVHKKRKAENECTYTTTKGEQPPGDSETKCHYDDGLCGTATVMPEESDSDEQTSMPPLGGVCAPGDCKDVRQIKALRQRAILLLKEKIAVTRQLNSMLHHDQQRLNAKREKLIAEMQHTGEYVPPSSSHAHPPFSSRYSVEKETHAPPTPILPTAPVPPASFVRRPSSPKENILPAPLLPEAGATGPHPPIVDRIVKRERSASARHDTDPTNAALNKRASIMPAGRGDSLVSSAGGPGTGGGVSACDMGGGFGTTAALVGPLPSRLERGGGALPATATRSTTASDLGTAGSTGGRATRRPSKGTVPSAVGTGAGGGHPGRLGLVDSGWLRPSGGASLHGVAAPPAPQARPIDALSTSRQIARSPQSPHLPEFTAPPPPIAAAPVVQMNNAHPDAAAGAPQSCEGGGGPLGGLSGAVSPAPSRQRHTGDRGKPKWTSSPTMANGPAAVAAVRNSGPKAAGPPHGAFLEAPVTAESVAVPTAVGETPESGGASDEATCPACPAGGPSHSSSMMVCCDSCDTWFHTGCVGYVHDDSTAEESWYCPGCTTKATRKNEATAAAAASSLSRPELGVGKPHAYAASQAARYGDTAGGTSGSSGGSKRGSKKNRH
eukprot:GHVT01077790.1.p1 GENE.GHVT01077790.1~~GHVT01077790.1.p1  ORF type:complete len:752 (-),score=145.89 GHVT01077790.1:818-3073(-)